MSEASRGQSLLELTIDGFAASLKTKLTLSLFEFLKVLRFILTLGI